MEQEFDAFLKKKRIDPVLFKKHEPETFTEFKSLFLAMHPNSFTMQKLYLINILRRKYQFFPQTDEIKGEKHGINETSTNMATASKPAIRPKMSNPVIGAKKTDNDELLKKPAAPKPVIRPKIKTVTKVNEEDEESKAAPTVEKPKPVIKKPVVKPVMKKRLKEEEQEKFDDTDVPKAKKAVRPIIKPRIPKKED